MENHPCGPAVVARNRPGEADPIGAFHLCPGGDGAARADFTAGRRQGLQHRDRREGGAARTTVSAWLARYGQANIEGLADHERSGWPKLTDHCPVAKAWHEYGVALWREGLQVLHRPRAGRQNRQRGQSLSGPSRESHRALRRREDSNPRPRAHLSGVADAAPAAGSHDYVRHGNSSLFATLDHRPRHRRLQAPAPAPGVPGLPRKGCPGLPRGTVAPGDEQLRRAQDI